MAGIHNIKVSEQHSGNLPNYRWYIECTCGNQMRMATEELAMSQFRAHQQFHGYVEPSEEEKNEPKNSQEAAALASKESGLIGGAVNVGEEKKEGNGGNSGGLRKLGQT